MNASEHFQPPSDSWIASIHMAEHDLEPIGAALIIDTRRVLTCAHVVTNQYIKRDPLWVAFPKADGADMVRRRVATVNLAHIPPVKDLALLVLEEPIPEGVDIAPLRCPRSSDMVGCSWWAFGFPNHDPVGNSADGMVGASLTYGWVRLDTRSRYLVEPGFSGGGLWSPDYQAVVAVVGQAHSNGDGRAITLHQADLCFPDHELRALANWSLDAVGEEALAAWGWTLARDPEGVRHWRPRARGVSIDSERGYRFRGRVAALTHIVRWLDRSESDRRALVVTGSPGVGKSAVLGRIVTSADASFRAQLPPSDVAVRAKVGSVSCAVHAKGKTALEVAVEIARAASATLPSDAGDLAPAVRGVLAEGTRARFNVIIDALDEAAGPGQVRAIITRIVLPLVETCSDVGAQVVIGTRRRDDGGDLLALFGGAIIKINLDDPEYAAEDDLTAYALSCLQLAGDERHGSPYADDNVARPLARRIAELADGNFLVAGLIGRAHGMHDEHAADPAHLGFSPTVDSALAAFVERLAPLTDVSAKQALTALAFAEAPGLPAQLWSLAIESIYGTRISTTDLAQFALSSAANFIVQTGRDEREPVFRLFHQALNDALLQARGEVTGRIEDEGALTRGFMRYGRRVRWASVPDYLRRSLPGHAIAAGLVDDLLREEDYFLYADLRRLLLAADYSTSQHARNRSRLLRLTPKAITAGPQERVALFSVTEALEGLGSSYDTDTQEVPYRVRWARAGPRAEEAVLTGHEGSVNSLCVFKQAGRDLLASASDDDTVRIWDPAIGEQRAVLEGHENRVNAVCTLELDGQFLLASAGDDGSIRIWDPVAGEQRVALEEHEYRKYKANLVSAVCTLSVGGQLVLASAGADRTIRIWNPVNGQQQAILRGHQHGVDALCTIRVSGHDMLASADSETVRIWKPATGYFAILRDHQHGATALNTVIVNGQEMLVSAVGSLIRIWNPATGRQIILRGHLDTVMVLCAITVNGREMLASGAVDDTVRIWDPVTGKQQAMFSEHQGSVLALCPLVLNGRSMLASAGDDDTVRIWDPAIGHQRASSMGAQVWVTGLCTFPSNGRPMLASASDDYVVRVWDLATGEERAAFREHRTRIRGICAITLHSRLMMASVGGGTVRIWDPATGEQKAVLEDDRFGVYALCAVEVGRRNLLVAAGAGGATRIWDPANGELETVLVHDREVGLGYDEDYDDDIYAVCAFAVENKTLLATVGADTAVRIWDPATGEQLDVLRGHEDWVNGVCAFTSGVRTLLATASADRTVRIWDAVTGEELAILEGHQDSVRGVCAVRLEGRSMVASASLDGTVRVWDPETATCMLTVPVHHAALAVSWSADSLIVALTRGLLVLEL